MYQNNLHYMLGNLNNSFRFDNEVLNLQGEYFILMQQVINCITV